MATVAGFWSYVHSDDDAEGGRISQLAQDVRSEFELLTGEPIELFLDRDDIEWGDRWRERIDAGLATVAFFVAVLTPRFFASAECRRELQSFTRRATKLGVRDLVLPLLYVDVASLHEESTVDELALLVRELQRVDWTDLRFCNPESEEYRRGIGALASRLVAANAEAERVDAVEAATQLEEPRAEEDEPGWLDQMAKAESTMPEWTKTLDAIRLEIEAIGEVLKQATADIQLRDAQGQGLAARLTIARRLSQQLSQPAEIIHSLEMNSRPNFTLLTKD